MADSPDAPQREQLALHHKETFRRIRDEFEDFDQKAAETHLNLIRTSDMIMRAAASYLRSYELTPPSMGMLIILYGAGRPVPMGLLGERLIVTAANVTGIVDTLEKNGSARRVPDEKDRRVTMVEITQAGRKKLRALLPEHFRRLKSLYSGLSPAEHRTLVKALELIRSKLAPFLCAALLLTAAGARALTVAAPQPPALSPRRAVETALRRNPGLETARAALDAALSAQLKVLAAHDTSLGLSLSRADSKTPPVVFFQTVRTVADSSSLTLDHRFVTGTQTKLSSSLKREKDGVTSTFTPNPRLESKLDLSLTQPLLKGFIGLPERSAVKESGLSVRSAKASLEREAELLAQRTLAAYWALWRSRRSVKVAEAAQEEDREFLAATRKLLARFEAEKDDLLRAEASLSRKELALLEAEDGVLDRVEELRALMDAPASDVELAEMEGPPEPDGIPSFKDAHLRAMKNRKDLAARRLDAERDRLHLESLAGLGLPDLSLTAGLGWSALKTTAHESFSQLGRMGYRTWNLGLNLSYAFGARADEGDRLAARSARTLSDAMTHKLHLEVARDVSISVRALRLAKRRMEVAERLASQLDEVLRITSRKYRQGRISSRDRLQAASEALDARGARLQAEEGWAVALSAEKASEGTLLDWLKVDRGAWLGGGR